jgi:hypothetical protein
MHAVSARHDVGSDHCSWQIFVHVLLERHWQMDTAPQALSVVRPEHVRRQRPATLSHMQRVSALQVDMDT